VRDVLTCWHNAARSEYGFDQDKKAWLNECETTLAELLSTRSDLRKLAASPLLCSLLCALYQDGNMHLPRDRKSLYEAALDLLLVRWDEQRRLTVGLGLPLNKEEQLMLLQVFAYSLVKNSQNSLDMAEATKRFTHGMRGLRHYDASPTTVLRHMLERTGLLLEPYPDQVEFVHRTFRDYLAAKEVVDCGDYNLPSRTRTSTSGMTWWSWPLHTPPGGSGTRCSKPSCAETTRHAGTIGGGTGCTWSRRHAWTKPVSSTPRRYADECRRPPHD
jgi:hypothetical protein